MLPDAARYVAMCAGEMGGGDATDMTDVKIGTTDASGLRSMVTRSHGQSTSETQNAMNSWVFFVVDTSMFESFARE